jgi:hypothetical protein
MGTSSAKVADAPCWSNLDPEPITCSSAIKPGAPRSKSPITLPTEPRRQGSGLKHRPSEKPVASKPDNHR